MEDMKLNLLYVKDNNMHQFACTKAMKQKKREVNDVISRAIEHARKLKHSNTLKPTF